jgi:hypothetical protein
MNQASGPGIPELHPIGVAMRTGDDPAAVGADRDVAHLALGAQPANLPGMLDVEDEPTVVHGGRDRAAVRGDGKAIVRASGLEDLRRPDRKSRFFVMLLVRPRPNCFRPGGGAHYWDGASRDEAGRSLCALSFDQWVWQRRAEERLVFSSYPTWG